MRRLVALVFCLCVSAAASAETRRPFVVVLDAGHGGPFPHDGAHGPRGLVEKDVALAVTLRLKELLEQSGATVVLTRESDANLPLWRRVLIANESGADLFLSIHCNSMPKLKDRLITRGAETYFVSPDPTDREAKALADVENEDAAPEGRAGDPVSGILADLALGQARNDSAHLAEIVQRRLVRDAHVNNRGVRQAPFSVLAGTKMPSALVEIGFISHPIEGRMLGRDYHQRAIARALAAGVQEYADEVLTRRLVASQAHVVLPEIVLVAHRPPRGNAKSAAPVAAAGAAR